MNHQHPEGHDLPPSFWKSRYAMGLLVIGGVAGYFLITEHWAHFLGALPYLLLLACPLMHIFMHGGHHHHGTHSDHDRASDASDRKPGEPS
ncbi:DUF2933 domain-containing protein [Chitinilyticum litopenaei]|uniref:DUF2933 domain-containing protein n=1 Tax=Chitinilyticum litopenaei TaxID=1121276 RepID=UPI0004904F08|nr:DUF2933 domain-containing protein [Chitinilyticum litopenaei]